MSLTTTQRERIEKLNLILCPEITSKYGIEGAFVFGLIFDLPGLVRESLLIHSTKGIISKIKLRSIIQTGVESEQIVEQRQDPDGIKQFISEKAGQFFPYPNPEWDHCEWCGGQSPALQRHHYPLPRSEGGKDTVKICGSCHAEFHFYESDPFYCLSAPMRLRFVNLKENGGQYAG